MDFPRQRLGVPIGAGKRGAAARGARQQEAKKQMLLLVGAGLGLAAVLVLGWALYAAFWSSASRPKGHQRPVSNYTFEL